MCLKKYERMRASRNVTRRTLSSVIWDSPMSNGLEDEYHLDFLDYVDVYSEVGIPLR